MKKTAFDLLNWTISQFAQLQNGITLIMRPNCGSVDTQSVDHHYFPSLPEEHSGRELSVRIG